MAVSNVSQSGFTGKGKERSILRASAFTTFFSPADLSPSLWLDASDATTITASGGDVSQWNNKGSLGNFTQATGALQPKTGATTQNGLNAIDFASDYLTSADAASSYKFLHDGTDHIIAIVLKATAGTEGGVYGTNAGTGANPGAWWYADINTGQRRMWHNVTDGTGNVVSNKSAVDSTVGNTWYVTTCLTDPGNATAADRSSIFINGGAAQKNSTASLSASASNPNHVMQIGALGNANSPFTGSIAEIIIVSGANATETNRAALRDYLNGKWGVY